MYWCRFLSRNNFLCLTLLSFLLIESSSCLKVGCKDEDNHDVDWFVNYKLPKFDDGYPDTPASEGKAYAFISSSKPGNWKLSSQRITSESSMLAKTLGTFFGNKKRFSYLFYNDEPPDGYNGTANGHLKGIVAFDGKSGFWIVHSIPKFSDVHEYSYPSNALLYGQSILCVTFNTSSLNEICRQLLYCTPMIYERGITDEVLPFLDDKAKTIFTEKPNFNRKPPFKRSSELKSHGKERFISYAKDGLFKDDIYSSIIAPDLNSSLAAETWRRGSGTYLPPACESIYTVTDITSIKMTVKNGTRNEDISFSSKDDHSKWAVSADSSQSWVCVGDMNRMASQARRGGGALCFQSLRIGNAYQSLISDSDQCPTM